MTKKLTVLSIVNKRFTYLYHLFQYLENMYVIQWVYGVAQKSLGTRCLCLL